MTVQSNSPVQSDSRCQRACDARQMLQSSTSVQYCCDGSHLCATAMMPLNPARVLAHNTQGPNNMHTHITTAQPVSVSGSQLPCTLTQITCTVQNPARDHHNTHKPHPHTTNSTNMHCLWAQHDSANLSHGLCRGLGPYSAIQPSSDTLSSPSTRYIE